MYVFNLIITYELLYRKVDIELQDVGITFDAGFSCRASSGSGSGGVIMATFFCECCRKETNFMPIRKTILIAELVAPRFTTGWSMRGSIGENCRAAGVSSAKSH